MGNKAGKIWGQTELNGGSLSIAAVSLLYFVAV